MDSWGSQQLIIFSSFLRELLRVARQESPRPGVTDTTLLLQITAGLVAGSSTPVGTSIDPDTFAQYVRIQTLRPYQEAEVNIGTLTLKLCPDPQRPISAERAAWYAYAIIRFCIRPSLPQTLSLRLRRIAHHHRQSELDGHNMASLVETLRQNQLRMDIKQRCAWWADFCRELAMRRFELSVRTRDKFIGLSARAGLDAYDLFSARGGHEGCLDGTLFEKYEPVLFNSPPNPPGLYLATMHMLRDKIEDGSIFSDEIEPTATPSEVPLFK